MCCSVFADNGRDGSGCRPQIHVDGFDGGEENDDLRRHDDVRPKRDDGKRSCQIAVDHDASDVRRNDEA